MFQVLCLSATYSDAAAAQAESLMRSPSHVRLGRESPALLGLNQLVRRLPPVATAPLRQAAKATELIKVLSSVTFNQCLVFSGSQLRAESLCHRLRAEGWPAAHLTGAQCQTERLAALKALCSHQCRVLVATDLAARGLDSPHVNLVISLDLPPDPATYLHRAGRAGRYGSRGAAVTLVCSPEEWYGVRAIATLANVRLMVVGQEWPGNLATHKIEGLKRTGLEKTEKGEKGEKPRQEEPEGGKDTHNSDKENRTQDERQKERENRKDGEGKSRHSGKKAKDEDGATRLEEVEHLPEEEARTWLKEHRPYRKVDGQGKQGRQENGVAEREEDKTAVRGEKDPSKGVEGDVKGKKARKKRCDGEDEVKDVDEDKENGKENKSQTVEDTPCSPGRQTDTQKPAEDNTSDSKTKEEISEELACKIEAMSFVKRLWKRSPPVTVSYPDLLSDCTQHYSTASPPDAPLRVPPWPVQVNPTVDEDCALEIHLVDVKEAVARRKVELEGDALTVLTALMEGKVGEGAGEGTQEPAEASNVLPPREPVSQPPQERDSDASDSSGSSSSSSSSEHLTSEHSKAHKKLLSSASERNHSVTTTSSSTDSKKTSSGANPELGDTKHKSPSIECKNPPHTFSDRRQCISPPGGHVAPPRSTRDTGPDREHPQRATGTRPKAERKQPKESRAETNNQKSNRKTEAITNSHSGYGEWVPVEKECQKKGPDHKQAYDQGYEGQDHASQAYNHDYQNYNQWNQGYYQEYQDYGQGYYHQEYQNYNQNYDQDYQDYNHTYQPGYYYQDYSHRYPYAGAATHTRTPDPHTNAYVESACKFASMMEYVTTMGRVSLQVAQDYHSRNKQWQRHHRHSNAP